MVVYIFIGLSNAENFISRITFERHGLKDKMLSVNFGWPVYHKETLSLIFDGHSKERVKLKIKIHNKKQKKSVNTHLWDRIYLNFNVSFNGYHLATSHLWQTKTTIFKVYYCTVELKYNVHPHNG